jgi:hypothetical protein
MSDQVGQRENAFRIFSTTPGIIEKQHEDTVLSAFTKGFKDTDVAVGISGTTPIPALLTRARSAFPPWKLSLLSSGVFPRSRKPNTTP